jgi:nucleoid-associated protein YgaU
MNRRIIFGLLLICLLGAPSVFAQTSDHLRDNDYYLESVRLANLAHAAFEEGDYDAARQYAEEAVHYAELSDEYVALQVRLANDAALAAGRPPITTTPGQPTTTTPTPSGAYALPAQYTVGTWATTKDCFWNIAALASVYNDPWQWRTLYNANKASLPDPNNPDLVHPGTVLVIPSIRGETRDGMYVAGRNYVSLPR